MLLSVPFSGRAQDPAGPPAGQAPTSAPAMPPAPPQDLDSRTAVRLSEVDGTVRLSGSSVFDKALQNMAVLPGTTVETGNDGRAELEFPDGSLVRVTPNSAVLLSGESAGRAGKASLTLQATRGLTYYELAAASGYGVVVGPLTARVLPAQPGEQSQGAQVNQASQVDQSQGALLRVNLDKTPYQASVLRGSVHFEDATGNATYTLQANETAKIDPAAATDYDIEQDVATDSWDAWNADRDSVRAQIAGSAHTSGENAGPGWDDLNYYGSWYDVPGEGMAWAPDGVGENFDPYGSGAWGYYTTAGYGWVSSYPWGWLPYHCGYWNYFSGYGFMWQPAGCGWGAGAGYGGGGGWYLYNELRRVPYGYHRPAPPTGIAHRPHQMALVPVRRGPVVQFRAVGDPRPSVRAPIVAGATLRPLPVESRPSYRAIVPGGEVNPAQGSMGLLPSGQSIYSTMGSRIVPSSPGGAGPRPMQMPPMQMPRAPVYVPAPRMSAPPPPPASAPHVSAPAAPSGHGH